MNANPDPSIFDRFVGSANVLRFKKPIQIDSLFTVDEVLDRLRATTIPTLSLRRLNPFAPEMLVGYLDEDNGRLRPKLKGWYFISARDLYFSLVRTTEGSRLSGNLDLSLTLKWNLIASVIFFVIEDGWIMVEMSRHAESLHALLKDFATSGIIQGLILFALVLYAFCWICIWFGRSDERALVMLVHRALQSPQTSPPYFKLSKKTRTTFPSDQHVRSISPPTPTEVFIHPLHEVPEPQNPISDNPGQS